MRKYYTYKLKNLLNVDRIVTIHYFEFSKGFRAVEEAHDFWEFVYAQKEDIVCYVDGEAISLSEGEILFYRPNVRHSLSANGKSAPNVFVMSFVCKSDAMSFFEGRRIKVDPALVKLIYRIFEEGKKTFKIDFSDPNLTKMELHTHPALGGEQLIKNYLEIFLIEMLRSQTETPEGNSVFLPRKEIRKKPVADVIEVLQNGLGESLTIQDICDRTSYGRSYLFRVFKAQTGQTIIEYYTHLKIERAKQLLRENEMTVKEISDCLSFGEPGYFSKTFKRAIGMTPTEYKKRAEML